MHTTCYHHIYHFVRKYKDSFNININTKTDLTFPDIGTKVYVNLNTLGVRQVGVRSIFGVVLDETIKPRPSANGPRGRRSAHANVERDSARGHMHASKAEGSSLSLLSDTRQSGQIISNLLLYAYFTDHPHIVFKDLNDL